MSSCIVALLEDPSTSGPPAEHFGIQACVASMQVLLLPISPLSRNPKDQSFRQVFICYSPSQRQEVLLETGPGNLHANENRHW